MIDVDTFNQDFTIMEQEEMPERLSYEDVHGLGLEISFDR